MTPALRAVVADDEAMSRARLCRLLGQMPGVAVVGECADGDEAIASIRRLRPDVVFLDVRMPALHGFGVIDALPHALRPQVVFVTAHAEHALRAFDADATDYLLKPFSAERLRDALMRVRRALGEAPMPDAPPATATMSVPTECIERLAVPVGPRLQMLGVDEIDCVLAQSNYVELCAGSQRYRLRETLTALEARLDPRRFVRVHRSRLVRLDAIRDVEVLGGGRYLLRLHSGLRVGTGTRFRERVRAMLGLAAGP
ncbi:LytR/AlgR family response regulator transcription factor [Lysobacter arvi]|uniref:Response regulator n=1 Tax=Lysobacter arvi TaxID=3038776 RepID=A0ABU1CBY9_9GAMM|nr:response regulator [Lysobacter arvi]MDR0182701.1 response regulator [Lysobacter arvi]